MAKGGGIKSSKGGGGAVTAASIEKDLRRAYLQQTGGEVRTRVLLSDLRSKLGATREDFDHVLLGMQRKGKVVLMGLDNPADRTTAVEAGALHIAGRPRHLVYFQK